jgi:hypothetical protein
MTKMDFSKMFENTLNVTEIDLSKTFENTLKAVGLVKIDEQKKRKCV